MPTRTTLPTVSTASGTAVPSPTSAIALERLELVSDATSVGGDGGNAWGGHQTRLVRTSCGLFTAYTVPGTDSFQHEWRLVQQTDDGWQIIAKGPSGRDPVNLLQGSDETIYLVAWPEGLPVIWASAHSDGELTFIVHDNGRGISKSQVSGIGSLGLIGMRERVRPWNGQVAFDGAPNRGTTVTVRIPTANAEGVDDDPSTRR